MDFFSIWHWMIVIAIVLLLFGRGKVSDLMGDIAQGVKAFKKGIADNDTTDNDTPGEDKTKVAQVGYRQAEGEVRTSEAGERAESGHS